jgi:hypothetical protein
MNKTVEMVYRIGPLSLTVLMLVGSCAYYPWRHYGSWRVYAILFGGLVSLVWHLLLIGDPDFRLEYIAYAVINLAAYGYLGLYCLMLVTGDAL